MIDLQNYLAKLISPPDDTDGVPVMVMNADQWDASAYEDGTLNGLIVHGTVTPEQSVSMLAKLKPGAHLLCVAPDDQPTNHTAACNLEDAGFEIRDSILLIDEPSRFHYVPKPSRAEREGGLAGKVKPVKRDDTRKEGNPGGDNPRNRGVNKRLNGHPTIKPIDLMERLLEDVPKDALVVDPFLGSGTTGIAALRTGHDFIGIEREPDYLKIADARVRHHDAARAGWNTATITSDVPKDGDESEPEGMGLEDLFGWGD